MHYEYISVVEESWCGYQNKRKAHLDQYNVSMLKIVFSVDTFENTVKHTWNWSVTLRDCFFYISYMKDHYFHELHVHSFVNMKCFYLYLPQTVKDSTIWLCSVFLYKWP